MNQSRLPKVAILGRTNAGKSTLFNRLLGRRQAITLDTPGVTRDPISADTEWDEVRLTLVDTGGLGGEPDLSLAAEVHEHTLAAVGDADVYIVVFDAKAGLSPLDADTVATVKRLGQTVVYVANKTEGNAARGVAEFCALGIDLPLSVSAEHGQGIGDLKDAVLELLEKNSSIVIETDEQERAPAGESTDPLCRVAILGRPNVGKSSFANLVAGARISLVDDKPGTTRDVVDTLIHRDGRDYLMLDTAGLRRPSRVVASSEVEQVSVRRSLGAMARAHVALLMIEPIEGVSDQDARIARVAWSEGRALVVVVNKIDMVSNKRRDLEFMRDEMRRRYPHLRHAPIGFMSVTHKRGINECFELINAAYAAHNRKVATSHLNRIIAEAVERRQPPVMGRGRLKLFYATQTAVRPPTVDLFVNRTGVPPDYQRFIERCLREDIDFEGTPLRLRFIRRSSH
ncbi:MAG: ribosome biogenesis GTPase Der [Deltaproteobacteria bacterium]